MRSLKIAMLVAVISLAVFVDVHFYVKTGFDFLLPQEQTAAVAVATGNPVGYFDAADCTALQGWTYDGDSVSTAVGVDIYQDGQPGTGTYLGRFSANSSRPDVNAVYNNTIGPNHGYYVTTPSSLKDGKSHSLYVYAINVSGTAGTNVQLTGSPKTITCTPPVVVPTTPIPSPTPVTPTPSPSQSSTPTTTVPTSTPTIPVTADDSSIAASFYAWWTGLMTIPFPTATQFIPPTPTVNDPIPAAPTYSVPPASSISRQSAGSISATSITGTACTNYYLDPATPLKVGIFADSNSSGNPFASSNTKLVTIVTGTPVASQSIYAALFPSCYSFNIPLQGNHAVEDVIGDGSAHYLVAIATDLDFPLPITTTLNSLSQTYPSHFVPVTAYGAWVTLTPIPPLPPDLFISSVSTGTTASINKVAVSWPAVPQAVNYTVYRSVGRVTSSIGSTGVTTMSDASAPADAQYSATASNNNGQTSVKSDPISEKDGDADSDVIGYMRYDPNDANCHGSVAIKRDPFATTVTGVQMQVIANGGNGGPGISNNAFTNCRAIKMQITKTGYQFTFIDGSKKPPVPVGKAMKDPGLYDIPAQATAVSVPPLPLVVSLIAFPQCMIVKKTTDKISPTFTASLYYDVKPAWSAPVVTNASVGYAFTCDDLGSNKTLPINVSSSIHPYVGRPCAYGPGVHFATVSVPNGKTQGYLPKTTVVALNDPGIINATPLLLRNLASQLINSLSGFLNDSGDVDVQAFMNAFRDPALSTATNNVYSESSIRAELAKLGVDGGNINILMAMALNNDKLKPNAKVNGTDVWNQAGANALFYANLGNGRLCETLFNSLPAKIN